jgi:hypothetical protein
MQIRSEIPDGHDQLYNYTGTRGGKTTGTEETTKTAGLSSPLLPYHTESPPDATFEHFPACRGFVCMQGHTAEPVRKSRAQFRLRVAGVMLPNVRLKLDSPRRPKSGTCFHSGKLKFEFSIPGAKRDRWQC